MIENWEITMYVWPFSGVDKKWVGGKEQKFRVHAKDFDDAVIQGNNILTGIRTNPDVWQAGILGVMRVQL